jgi:putative nucleotidyltransferase with HDIG domain
VSVKATNLVKETVQIGSLPGVFFQINEAVENPRTSFSDIGRIISADTALCARLLKVVNSSYFGFSSQIETITHAITVVGMLEVRDLVLATTVIRYFRGMSEDRVSMESFWRHSIACGVAARTLAIYRREPNPERYYVAGLMHDLGRLILFMNNHADMAKVFELYDEGGLLVDAERSVLGVDHAEVGAALMEKWKLPVTLVDIIRHHHNPSLAAEKTLDASIVHLSDILVHALEFGNSGERYVPALDENAWDQIGLPVNELSSLLQRIKLQADDLARTFLSS